MFKFIKSLFVPETDPDFQLEVGKCYHLPRMGNVVKIVNLEDNGKIVHYVGYPCHDSFNPEVVSHIYFKRLYKPL